MKFWFLTFLPLFFFGCGSAEKPHQDTPPSIIPSKIDIPAFDADNAFRYLLAQTNFGPRNPGSSGHQHCLQFLTLELGKYADVVSQQTFQHTGYEGRSYRLTNVIASFNPESTYRILLGAHWDTRPRAERDPDPSKRSEPILGANDGASGVAVLLEIARIIHNNPPPIGIDIILFDGEDYGHEGDLDNYCIGAKYFARNLPPGFRPRYGVILDMVGDKELRIPREGYSMQYAPWVVNLIWETAASERITQFENRLASPIYDDHLPLNQSGIPTALLIDLDLIGYDGPDTRRRYWHTTMDTPEQCSPESLNAVGSLLAHIIYRIQI